MGDVAAGAELDLEDLTIEAGGGLLAQLLDGLATQGEVGEAGQDLICGETRGVSPSAQGVGWRSARTIPVRPPSSSNVAR